MLKWSMSGMMLIPPSAIWCANMVQLLISKIKIVFAERSRRSLMELPVSTMQYGSPRLLSNCHVVPPHVNTELILHPAFAHLSEPLSHFIYWGGSIRCQWVSCKCFVWGEGHVTPSYGQPNALSIFWDQGWRRAVLPISMCTCSWL